MSAATPNSRLDVFVQHTSTDRAAVVMLHGRGQSRADARHLLRSLQSPGVTWVLPQAAPNSWYDCLFMDVGAARHPHVLRALADVDTVVGDLGAIGFEPRRIVIAGFSQGACLATQYVLTHPRRYAGVAVMTGGYIGEPGVEPPDNGSLDGTPVVLTSVTDDAWVPVSRVYETSEVLKKRGANVQLLVQEGDVHAVSPTAAALTRDLVARAAASV